MMPRLRSSVTVGTVLGRLIVWLLVDALLHVHIHTSIVALTRPPDTLQCAFWALGTRVMPVIQGCAGDPRTQIGAATAPLTIAS